MGRLRRPDSPQATRRAVDVLRGVDGGAVARGLDGGLRRGDRLGAAEERRGEAEPRRGRFASRDQP